jgi:uncharacterized membrane protein
MDSSERFHHARSVLQGALWVIPTLAVVTAIALGLWLGQVEAEPEIWGVLVFDGGASAARSLLEAIVTALITVTSLTFSLMVVVLQTAASEYSPRLLRTFLRDLKNQAVLAIFLSTFAFAVVVLPNIQDEGAADGDGEFVPRLAVTVTLVLAIASIAALVLLIANITQSIRVDAIMRGVAEDTADAIERTLHHLDSPSVPDQRTTSAPPHAVPVYARRSGYIQAIKGDQLVRDLRRRDTVVLYRRAVGEQVIQGAPLALAWSSVDERPLADVAALEEILDKATTTGYERTLESDVAFGLRQLTDIAVKALSPSKNDPSTAVDVLGRLASVLRELADHHLGAEECRDEDGVLRANLPRPRFADYLDLVMEPVTRYGCGDLGVVVQILRVLEDLGAIVDTEERERAVLDAVDLVVARAEEQMTLERSLGRVRQAAGNARSAVRGRVPHDDVFVL